MIKIFGLSARVKELEDRLSCLEGKHEWVVCGLNYDNSPITMCKHCYKTHSHKKD